MDDLIFAAVCGMLTGRKGGEADETSEHIIGAGVCGGSGRLHSNPGTVNPAVLRRHDYDHNHYNNDHHNFRSHVS